MAERKDRFVSRDLEQEELDIRCLQILRGAIHNEERKLPEEWHLHSGESSVKRCLKI